MWYSRTIRSMTGIAAAAACAVLFAANGNVRAEEMQIIGASPGPENSTPEVAVSQRLVLHDVMINGAGSQIDPSAKPLLDYAARLLAQNPSTLVYVGGTGDRATVMRQSRAVTEYLKAHGVPANRLILEEAAAPEETAPNDGSNAGVVVLNLTGPSCATCAS